MDKVQTPIIPIIADLIDQNPGTISLGQGVVYYGPPRSAFERLHELNTANGIHKYGHTGGLSALREIITGKLLSENNIKINNSSSVIVTAGSNMAFLNALFAITNPGDEIILFTPYYFNHEMAVRMLTCIPVFVSTDEQYQPVMQDLRKSINSKTRAIVTISPNNPSGAVYPEELLGEINALCVENKLYHISDEAYEYFTYEGIEHFSPGSIPGAGRHTISLYSLSKAFGLASWRIGYMVIPDYLTEAVYKAQDTNLICPAIASQYAAIGAMQEGVDYCRDKLGIIKEVRSTILSHLEKINSFARISRSEGAFYLLIKLETELDDITIAKRLISKFKVAVLPGSTFGLNNGCYLRVAFGALDKNNALEGIQRLTHGLTTIIE
jgi:aspartate/methionine/tyrosine aminotransferase